MPQADHVTKEKAKAFAGRRKWFFIAMVALSLLLVSSVLGYAFARQPLLDFFFPSTAKEAADDLVNHEEQAITIDDHTTGCDYREYYYKKICYGVNRSDYAPDADDQSGEYICKISFRELIDYKQVIGIQMNQKTYYFA